MRSEWLYDRILRAPDAGNGEGGAAGGESGSAAGSEGGGEGAASPPPNQDKGTPDPTNKPKPQREPHPSAGPQRPEWLPEKLWGDGAKFVKEGKFDQDGAAAALSEAYRNAESRLHTRTDDLKRQVREEFMAERGEGVPEKADGYQIAVSEDFQKRLPEGYEVAIDPKGSLWQFVSQFAHHHKIPQDDVSKLVEAYVDARLQEFPDFQEERKKLGENADARIDSVNGWMEKHLTKESYGVLAGMATKAELVVLLEELMELAGTPRIKPDTVGRPGDQKLTREELQQMQKDPRYAGNNPDPAFVQKVRAGFRALAGQRK